MPLLLAMQQVPSPPELQPQQLAPLFCQAAALLLGIPFLVRFIREWLERGGWGWPRDGAWPNVCWSRQSLGFGMVITAFGLLLVVAHLLHTLHLALQAHQPRLWPEAGTPLDMLAQTSLTCLQWLMVCGALLLTLRKNASATLASLGLTWDRARAACGVGLRTLLAAMPPVIVTLYLGGAIYALVTKAPSAQHPILQTFADSVSPSLATLLAEVGLAVVTIIIIPFFEELFFRGVIQTSLMRTGRPWLAIGISSALFGLLHLGMPGGVTSVVPLTILGFFLGYAFYRTRSLVTCYVMHAAFNGYNILLLTLTTMLTPAAPAPASPAEIFLR